MWEREEGVFGEKLSERGVAAVVGGVKKRHQRSARHGYDPELVGQFGRAHSSGLFVRHCVPSILRSKNVIIELPLLTTTSNVIACDNKRYSNFINEQFMIYINEIVIVASLSYFVLPYTR